MKKKNLIFSYNFFLIVFFTISSILNAQSDFQKGFIIKNNNDTLYGFLDFRNFVRSSTLCSFKRFENDTVIIFTPNEILGYRLLNDKYYVSREVETKDGRKDLFLELIIKGQANIFYYRDIYGEHYLIDKAGYPLKEIIYYEDIFVDDHVNYIRESTKHIGLLKAYLRDCPEIFDEIDNLKRPNRNNLTRLVKDYHYIICGENSCIVYEKQNPKLRIDIEPEIAFSKYNGSNEITQENGLILHSWLPLSSEKLYIKTGLIFSKPTLINSNDLYETFSFYKLPLAFEYIVPGKVFQSKFCYGINFYSVPQNGEFFTPTLGVGFLLKIFRHVYLCSELNGEATPILPALYIYHENPVWFSYSFDLGIRFRFKN